MRHQTPAVAYSTPALADTLSAQAGRCLLSGFEALSSAAGYLMIFDATSPPANGAVAPLKVYDLAAGVARMGYFEIPLQFNLGCILMCSSTGPFTLTKSTTAFMSADVTS